MTEGFICPVCLQNLGNAPQLMAHFQTHEVRCVAFSEEGVRRRASENTDQGRDHSGRVIFVLAEVCWHGLGVV
jgi:hypothetical protein